MDYPWIGLVGKAQSGKGTVGLHLVENYGYREVGFADPLREMALAINPILDIHEHIRYEEAVNVYGYAGTKSRFPEARRFLQCLGTEGGREILGEHIWVDAAVRKAEAMGAPCVFTDVRFPNEAQAIRDHGGVVVRIVRPHMELPLDPSLEAHASETIQDSIDVDAHIFNSRGFVDLYRQIDREFIHWLGLSQPDPMEHHA